MLLFDTIEDMLSPATAHALKKPFYPSDNGRGGRLEIREQRYLAAPLNAPDVKHAYPIDSLLNTARYLVKVEDRMLPVAFFAEPRYGFNSVIEYMQKLGQWKAEGYTHVLMFHGADPTVSHNQPFWKYYLWMNRLKTLKYLEPLRER